jgi:hypothetical protein
LPSVLTVAPVPTSSGSTPCIEVASPIAVPPLIWIGVTPDSVFSFWPAARMSSHDFGCQSAGSPAWANSFLLKYSTRPSVPAGTPYRLPSKLPSCCTESGICFQPSQSSTFAASPTVSVSGLT